MPVQQELFPDSSPGSAPLPGATPRGSAEAEPVSAVAPIWLQRMSLFILVIFCLYLGAIVTVLPWWTQVWDHNLFFTAHPQLWAVLRLRMVRGVISGLGLLDIWIGLSEAIHYREHRR